VAVGIGAAAVGAAAVGAAAAGAYYAPGYYPPGYYAPRYYAPPACGLSLSTVLLKLHLGADRSGLLASALWLILESQS
jgi:hypothetical protein